MVTKNTNINAKDIAFKVLEGVVTGTTNPAVTILNLRNQRDGTSGKSEPNPSNMEYGQFAINYDANVERIFIKNSANQLAVFEPSKKILKYVDEKDQALQDQIDIINSPDNVNGSFAYADKKLEEKLQSKIDGKVTSITGIKGVLATTDYDRNVTIEGVVSGNDKILGVGNSGFTSTLYLTYDWNSGTIKLFGKSPNDPISEFKIQTGEKLISAEPYIGKGNEEPPLIKDDLYIKYVFGTDDVIGQTIYCHVTPLLPVYNFNSSNTITFSSTTIDQTHKDITAKVNVSEQNDGEGFNVIKTLSDGIFVSSIIDSGLYNSSSRDQKNSVRLLYSNSNDEYPNPATLANGEVALNIFKDNEKIIFKNSSGTELAIFDTSKNILKVANEYALSEISKLTDPNRTGSLQYQINYEVSRAKDKESELEKKIDIINGDNATEGSFLHADKILEDKIMLLIDQITGGTGVPVVIIGGITNTASVDFDQGTKTITTNVRVSKKEGNNIKIETDGLFSDISEIDGGTF